MAEVNRWTGISQVRWVTAGSCCVACDPIVNWGRWVRLNHRDAMWWLRLNRWSKR